MRVFFTNRMLITFCFLLSSQLAFVQNKQNVKWNELVNSYDGNIGASSIVVVEPNDRLILTPNCNGIVTNIGVKGILVYGELVVENISPENNCSLELNADWILVGEGGLFSIGSESSAFTNKFQLTLGGNQGDFFLCMTLKIIPTIMLLHPLFQRVQSIVGCKHLLV